MCEIGNLPDTQPNEDINYVQTQEEEFRQPWGMLLATRSNFKTLELINDEYTIGRAASCDVTTSLLQMKQEILSTISKVHCRIKKEENAVFLEDLSFNGTHVNGNLVGKGKKIALKNNDQISLAFPHYKVFIFMDPSKYDGQNYPPEIMQSFFVCNVLGTGACGEVRIAFDKKTCKQYAIKIISKKAYLTNGTKNHVNDPDKMMNEVIILKALRHPNIIRIYDVVDTPNKLFIVLELMEGGELFDRIKASSQLEESEAKLIFYQIVRAVQYLHAQGIVHRDLKPENVLLASDKKDTLVKISDFGLSKFFSSQSILTTYCGTPMYVAPEILETKGRGVYTNQVDVWSLGVILYCCLSGLTPFSDNYMGLTLAEQIRSGTYTFPHRQWKDVSWEAVDLIKKMMRVDPKRRITINKISCHPWFQDEAMKAKVESLLHEHCADENSPPPAKRRCLDNGDV
ncbi:serine/threonine-protein kinase Chk2 [Anabrus simplex]|uniref:serine/threonine-protein kinase Chk2 n=1 Tax=Anabrus simplex TaxID=316456 RepID=UPI0035A2B855